MSQSYFFTSESVTEGHPDKVADQISDAILDAHLAQDPRSRVACEVLINTGLVVVSGEITTTAVVDINAVVRETIAQIGYTSQQACFDASNCAVLIALDKQSPDIAQGVVGGGEVVGAGDQGLMFGYACDQTDELMPLPIVTAHALTRQLARLRHDQVLDYLLPDGKAQVTFEYVDGVAKRLDAVVVSTQHRSEVDLDTVRSDMIEQVIKPICRQYLDEETKIHVNPTGRFVVGGPHGDCGLTGRKIIVDTYGGWARHGGGAFSGKDPSKVDRSAAYMARHVAKSIVAAGLAKECEVQLSYAIGVAEPTSVYVDTRGSSDLTVQQLEQLVRQNFDLTPQGIIDSLQLRQPLYKQVAAYGHLGRSDVDLPWEGVRELER